MEKAAHVHGHGLLRVFMNYILPKFSSTLPVLIGSLSIVDEARARWVLLSNAIEVKHVLSCKVAPKHAEAGVQ